MNTQYTPGPWQFKKVSVWAPTKPTEGIPVFEFCFTGGEEWMRTARANARLIAASPTLYEFAKRKAQSGDSEAKSMLASLGLCD